MVRCLLKISAAILLFGLTCPGCAYMSKSGRQQLAYQRYVKKHVRQRQHELARAQAKAKRQMKHDMQTLPANDPQVTATVDRMEPMADPITVSSSSGPESVPVPSQP
jgi:Na+-translocating ferredoxin:NAD+ oxidoreductase RnfC subunit